MKRIWVVAAALSCGNALGFVDNLSDITTSVVEPGSPGAGYFLLHIIITALLWKIKRDAKDKSEAGLFSFFFWVSVAVTVLLILKPLFFH